MGPKWMAILLKVMKGEDENKIPSLYDSHGIMKYAFVEIDKGYYTVWVWCSVTFRSVHFSNVKVPLNVKPITMEEFKNLELRFQSANTMK